MRMLVNGHVLCPLEVARGWKRIIGLMFRKGYSGALLFEDVKGEYFHTFFCRFPILFLFLDEDLVVRKTAVLPPWRVIRSDYPTVIELDARRGWRIEEGDRVEIEGGG